MNDKSLRFKWWSSLDTTVGLIRDWKPKECETHGQYLRSLHSYLSQRLKSINVVKESGHGRLRGDIVLNDKVVVEIKVNFDTTAKFQRGVGQIEGYLERGLMVIVVFCGKRDKNLIAQFKRKYEGVGPVWEKTFAIVEKA